MPKVSANGIELFYELDGPPGGELILLVTGFSDQLTHWPDELTRLLTGLGHRVLRYDSRDVGLSTWFDHVPLPSAEEMQAFFRGDSTPRAAYTLHDMARDALGLLDALQIPRAHWVGYSLGGLISQLACLAAPVRAASFVALMTTSNARGSSPPSPEAIQGASAASTRFASLGEAVEAALALVRAAAGSKHATSDVDARELYGAEYARAYHPEGSRRHLVALLATPRFADQLGALRTRTLVLHGTDDRFYGLDHARDLVRRIPDARLELLEGAGHSLTRSLAPELARAIDAHVRRASQR